MKWQWILQIETIMLKLKFRIFDVLPFCPVIFGEYAFGLWPGLKHVKIKIVQTHLKSKEKLKVHY